MDQKLTLISVLLLSLLSAEALELGVQDKSGRKGKLFFISTSSTTSTLSTTTICFRSSDTAMVVCPTKKRRAIQHDPFDAEEDINIEPTMAKLDETTSLENDHQSEVESGVRAGRFAVYWKTTTITSSSTSYTSTSTLASLRCTPYDFVLSACG